MPSTKAARGGIFSGVFQQGRQGTSQGQEGFELSWYLFFQHFVCKDLYLFIGEFSIYWKLQLQHTMTWFV